MDTDKANVDLVQGGEHFFIPDLDGRDVCSTCQQYADEADEVCPGPPED